MAAALCLGQRTTLFNGAYRVDLFSQVLKLVFACGFVLILLFSGGLEDIREEVKPEYYFFLTISVCGLMMLVSCMDIITLVVALEVSAFPLYLMVPMRRERPGQRSQMESAVKYMMFGVAANGIMFFGDELPVRADRHDLPAGLLPRLQPVIHSPLAIAGLAMTFCGLFYKLAVFPFHFWTPDVYQGASNETAGLIASLPKLGAVAVLVRFVSLASPDNPTLAVLLAILAAGSMFYGNLIALMQKDFKRLLGLLGHRPRRLCVDRVRRAGRTRLLRRALLHHRLPADGAGLLRGHLQSFARRLQCRHRGTGRAASPRAVAGGDAGGGRVRPGRHAALCRVHGQTQLALRRPGQEAIWPWSSSRVVNAAIAIYYYLCVVREAWFRDPGSLPRSGSNWPTRALCIAAHRRHPRPGRRPRPIPGRHLDLRCPDARRPARRRPGPVRQIGESIRRRRTAVLL